MLKFSNQDNYLNNILANEKLLDNPCDKCDGDSCGPVPFKFSELETIFKKYNKVPEFKKRFKANSTSQLSTKLIKIQALFGKAGDGDEGLIITFQKKNEYLKNGIKPGSCIFKRDEKITILSNFINNLKSKYDKIIIDAPPSFGIITTAILRQNLWISPVASPGV